MSRCKNIIEDASANDLGAIPNAVVNKKKKKKKSKSDYTESAAQKVSRLIKEAGHDDNDSSYDSTDQERFTKIKSEGPEGESEGQGTTEDSTGGHSHSHDFEVDAQGMGRTTSTSSGDAHEHKIKNYEVLPAGHENHTHEIKRGE